MPSGVTTCLLPSWRLRFLTCRTGTRTPTEAEGGAGSVCARHRAGRSRSRSHVQGRTGCGARPRVGDSATRGGRAAGTA